MPDFFWGRWDDYEKETYKKREYAKLGGRLYNYHTVERFLPSGRYVKITEETRPDGRKVIVKKGYGGFTESRSIPPRFIEEAILHGKTTPSPRNKERMIHVLGDLQVVTEDNARVVITVIYVHEP